MPKREGKIEPKCLFNGLESDILLTFIWSSGFALFFFRDELHLVLGVDGHSTVGAEPRPEGQTHQLRLFNRLGHNGDDVDHRGRQKEGDGWIVKEIYASHGRLHPLRPGILLQRLVAGNY